MSTADDFRAKFDAEGRFRDRDGEVPVVFATRSGGRFPGKLRFKNGLCVRAEMERGGDFEGHGARFGRRAANGEDVFGAGGEAARLELGFGADRRR